MKTATFAAIKALSAVEMGPGLKEIEPVYGDGLRGMRKVRIVPYPDAATGPAVPPSAVQQHPYLAAGRKWHAVRIRHVISISTKRPWRVTARAKGRMDERVVINRLE